MMRRVRLRLSYDGTDFSGYQIQPTLRTVQGSVEDVLLRLYGEPIQLVGCGRTDAGVHARNYIAHMDVPLGGLPTDRMPRAFAPLLPPDIVVHEATDVEPSFHARFNVSHKTYRYTLDRQPSPDIFTRRFSLHYPWALDISKMRCAAASLVGTHDFTSLCAAATPLEDKVRTIYAIDLVDSWPYLHIDVTGSGFLYNMVRIIVGTLLSVSRGRIRPADIAELLRARDRTLAGETMAPHGLVLWDVAYSPWLLKGDHQESKLDMGQPES